MDIIVHGGAGGAPDDPDPRQAVLENAARNGSRAGNAITAVREAVSELESDPQFNAGVGGAVQSDGRIRTDAGLMTSERSIGAACGMPDVANAIAVADTVRTETPHVMMAGTPAVRFAEAKGIPTDVDLWSDRTKERWTKAELSEASYPEQLRAVRERYGSGVDTVGAVATDGTTVAAATSTGGRWLALAGRVGDVPQVGAGFYASPAGGVSATGAGEDIARVTLSREVGRELESGANPDTAIERALETFDDNCSGGAGLIALSPDGTVGRGVIRGHMQVAVARDGEIDADRSQPATKSQ